MNRRGNLLNPIDTANTPTLSGNMLIGTDSSVQDGELVYVRDQVLLGPVFAYRLNSGLAPDGVNIFQALYGPGVWVRTSLLLGGGGGGIGATGATGAAGTAGTAGGVGATGSAGVTGATGATGAAGTGFSNLTVVQAKNVPGTSVGTTLLIAAPPLGTYVVYGYVSSFDSGAIAGELTMHLNWTDINASGSSPKSHILATSGPPVVGPNTGGEGSGVAVIQTDGATNVTFDVVVTALSLNNPYDYYISIRLLT